MNWCSWQHKKKLKSFMFVYIILNWSVKCKIFLVKFLILHKKQILHKAYIFIYFLDDKLLLRWEDYLPCSVEIHSPIFLNFLNHHGVAGACPKVKVWYTQGKSHKHSHLGPFFLSVHLILFFIKPPPPTQTDRCTDMMVSISRHHF